MPTNTLETVLTAKSLVGPAFDDLKKRVEVAEATIKKLSATSSQSGKQIEGAFSGASKSGASFAEGIAQGVGVAIPLSAAAAATAVTAMAVNTVKAAMSFETAFAGVTKTVDGTTEQIAGLREGILTMARQLPSSREQIAKVAEAAGQLGIKTENILSFTRTMVDLGQTTNLSSDQAATALARLANITGMPQEQFDRLGSTVVALGNKLATTEAEIVQMGLRLAGAGEQIGLTEAQILGFAGALSSVGIEAESGGSAFSRVMIDIANSVKTGDASLARFADVAGMSVDAFRTAFETDAAGAIVTFVEGLGKVDAAGGNTFQVLEDLGLSEIRVRDALLRTSNAGDLLRRSVDLGTKAWEDNNALTEEAAKRYETSASKMQVFQNKMSDLQVSLGEQLIPAILGTIGAFERLDDALDKQRDSAKARNQGILQQVAGFIDARGATIALLQAQFRLNAQMESGQLTRKQYNDQLYLLHGQLEQVAEAEKTVTKSNLAGLLSIESERGAVQESTSARAEQTKQLESVAKAATIYQSRLGNLKQLQESGAISTQEFTRRQSALAEEYKSVATAGNTQSRGLADLARQFATGQLSAAEYGQQVQQTTKALDSLTEGQYQAELKKLSDAWQFGAITTAEYDAGVKSLAATLERTGEQAAAAAKRAADAAAADAKRAADATASDAKRTADEVVRATGTALKAWEDYGSTLTDLVDDQGARIQDIQRKHTDAYNGAIDSAQKEQASRWSSFYADLAKLEDGAGKAQVAINARAQADTAETSKDWGERRADLVRQNGEKRVDIERDAEQRIIDLGNTWHRDRQDRVRDANDRRVDLERSLTDRLGREVDDRNRRLARQEEDARLAREERDEDRRLRGEDRGRDKTDTGQDAVKELAKAEKEFRKDAAAELARHQKALQEATNADARQKEEARHAEAVAKQNERYAEEQARITERRDERLASIDEQDARQQEADERRDAREAKQAELRTSREKADFERGQEDERTRSATQLATIQTKLDADLEALRVAREADIDRVRVTKEEALKSLEARQTKDLDALRVAKQAELDKTEAKRLADIQASNDTLTTRKSDLAAERDAQITASNDALVARQQQIDAQRDEDYNKFVADLGKRFREVEQQFGRSMRSLEDSIPAIVKALLGNAQALVRGASDQLMSAIPASGPDGGGEGGRSYSAGDTLPSGFQTQSSDEVINDNGSVRVWRDGQVIHRESAGYGAANDPQPALSGLFGSVHASLRSSLESSRRTAASLVGGDSRATQGPLVPTGVTPPVANSNALTWATSQLGNQSFNGLCQRFVEVAHGTAGRYASAKAASAALLTSAGGTLGDAPRNSLVFFRPDASNGGWGHVGISLGGGQFVSATTSGVSVDGPSRYWSGLYQGHGLPRFAGGGKVPGMEGQEQQIVAHGGELIFNPAQIRALNNLFTSPRSGAQHPITVNVTVQGSVQSEQDLARSIYNGLRELERSGLTLGSR